MKEDLLFKLLQAIRTNCISYNWGVFRDNSTIELFGDDCPVRMNFLGFFIYVKISHFDEAKWLPVDKALLSFKRASDSEIVYIFSLRD